MSLGEQPRAVFTFFGVWKRYLIAPTVYFSAELFNAYVTESKA